MHLTGPLQTAIIIVYVLLMVTNTLHSTESMEKLVSNTNQYSTVTKSMLKQRITNETQPQMKAVRRIWWHIRIARRQMKRQKNKIDEFYYNVSSVLRGVFVYEWLPKEHLKWFENKVRHLDKHKKVSTLIPVLYKSLSTFISTFKEMEQFAGDNQHVVPISKFNQRKEIINSILDDLQGVFFELEHKIELFGFDQDASINETRIEKGRNWDSKPDYTIILLQDWGVITTYYRFLKDWVQIGKYLYEDFCNATEPKHRCHAYLEKYGSDT